MIVTTDKVYQLKKNNPFYKENDALSPSDPYGTSKACVEMLCESYFKSYFKNLKIKMNNLRAGNVIGGGDYSKNRIVPDYLMSLNEKKSNIKKSNFYKTLAICFRTFIWIFSLARERI